MTGYRVDVGELRRAGNAVRDLGDAVRASSTLRYSIIPGEVGHDELAGALDEFEKQSGSVADRLGGDAGESALRLHDNATNYERADREIAGLIAGRDG